MPQPDRHEQGHRAGWARMSRTVLRGARWPGDVAFSGGRITAVGSRTAAGRRHGACDCDGDIVTAGLVNTHHHFYQWMTRGWAYDCDLFGWLTDALPGLGPADAGGRARPPRAVALAELALTGCTTAADHHYLVPGGDDSVFDAIAGPRGTIGIRAHIARGSMDLGESAGGLPPDSVVEDRDAILASTRRSTTGCTTATGSSSRSRRAARSASPPG